jgi:hypothetical protein
MFRKFTVALTATAIIAGAALAPTAASAKWWKHHHHGLGAAIVVGSAILASQVQQCPLIKQYYVNKWGHVRVRYVPACY